MKIKDEDMEELCGPKPPQNDKEREELENAILDSDWFKETEIEFNVIHIEVVPREKWGGLPPKGGSAKLPKPVKNLAISYNTNTEECKTFESCAQIVKKIQKRDISGMGRNDIAYNFLVGGDGRMYEGRGWETVPSLTEEQPNCNFKNTIEVAYIGNFEYQCSPISMVPTFMHWVRENVKIGNIAEKYHYK